MRRGRFEDVSQVLVRCARRSVRAQLASSVTPRCSHNCIARVFERTFGVTYQHGRDDRDAGLRGREEPGEAAWLAHHVRGLDQQDCVDLDLDLGEVGRACVVHCPVAAVLLVDLDCDGLE